MVKKKQEMINLTEMWDALEYYANPANYQESNDPDPKNVATGIIPIELDKGFKARQALIECLGDALYENGKVIK